jgi:serine/threonine-protein kinase
MAAGATLAVAAFAWQHAEERRRFDACVAESDSIASVWNESRARAIGRAFEATDLAFAAETWSRSEAYADAYVDAWQRRYSTMCERSVVLGTLDSASTSAARDCLTERRDEFAAMVDAASEPDAAAVRRSATAFASLARVDRCLDPASLERHASPPYSGPQRTRIHGVRARLARVYAAIASGRYDDANERAEAVLHEAQDLGWEPLIAEARLARGDAWSGLGRYEDAARESTEAYFEATAAMRDEAALRAANQLVHLLGQPLARPDEALQWSRRSEALVHRLGMERDLLEAFRLNAVGIVHRMRGDYAEAKAAHELSIAIKEEVLGPDHPHLANSLDNLGNALRLTKEHDSSLPLHRRALEIRRRSLGPNHPDVAVSMTNLGNWYAARGDAADRALELYRGALAIWKQTLEPDHPRLAAVLNNIGNLHWGRGEYEEALASHERAMLIREAAHGPNHHTVAASLHNIGLVHQSRGELADALAHFERAKAIATTVRGPKHPQVAMHLHSIGEVYAERGDLVAAIAAYEEALTIKQRAGLDARDVTLTQFALAEALSRHGGHRRRSRALAIAARDGYRSLGPAWVDSLAEVEAWLDAHPAL